MHYGHSIKYRYYFEGIYSLYRARKQRDSVVFKCINISDVYYIEKIFEILYAIYKLMLCITGIQLSTDI